jgi:hypothetical protein
MKNASCENSMKIDLERNRITAVEQFFRAALLLMVVFCYFRSSLLPPVKSLNVNTPTPQVRRTASSLAGLSHWNR